MIRFRIDVCNHKWAHPGATLKAEYKLWEDAATDLHAMGWSPFGTGLTTMWTSEQSGNYCVIRSESTESDMPADDRQYHASQLGRLSPTADDVRIKLSSDMGDTKWLSLTVDVFRKIADVLVGKL